MRFDLRGVDEDASKERAPMGIFATSSFRSYSASEAYVEGNAELGGVVSAEDLGVGPRAALAAREPFPAPNLRRILYVCRVVW